MEGGVEDARCVPPQARSGGHALKNRRGRQGGRQRQGGREAVRVVSLLLCFSASQFLPVSRVAVCPPAKCQFYDGSFLFPREKSLTVHG